MNRSGNNGLRKRVAELKRKQQSKVEEIESIAVVTAVGKK